MTSEEHCGDDPEWGVSTIEYAICEVGGVNVPKLDHEESESRLPSQLSSRSTSDATTSRRASPGET